MEGNKVNVLIGFTWQIDKGRPLIDQGTLFNLFFIYLIYSDTSREEFNNIPIDKLSWNIVLMYITKTMEKYNNIE